MYLMRVGALGAEKPVARIDDDTYVDLSDLVTDYNEAFFDDGGLDRIRPIVAECAAAGRSPTSPASASAPPSRGRIRSCVSA
jgi:2,4-didehydro-3-deoxy-L-rhamnonate hydrolase